jgi:protein TonB
MFARFSPFLRLFLCVLLSTGVHGGLVFYDWLKSPAETRLVNAPVSVSFLPAVDVATPAVEKLSSSLSVPAPVPTPAPVKKSPVARADQSRPVIQPVAAKVKQRVEKVLPEQSSVTVEVETPGTNEATEKLVCMASQKAEDGEVESHSDSLTDIVAEVPSLSARGLSGSVQNVVPNSEVDPLDSHAGQDVVAAVPSYRSNPLPDYPYLARQRRWEGVVWLLVDVSSEGLVDDVRIEQSCGYKVLDRSARRTVKRWQFSPATRAGLPVASQARIPVRFRLEGD